VLQSSDHAARIARFALEAVAAAAETSIDPDDPSRLNRALFAVGGRGALKKVMNYCTSLIGRPVHTPMH
jgi:hypothetical protein